VQQVVYNCLTLLPTRGPEFKLCQRFSRVDSRKHFVFAEQIIQPWNSLQAKNEHFLWKCWPDWFRLAWLL